MQIRLIAPDRPKFSLGRLVATPEALRHVSNKETMTAVRRHLTGDWGEVGNEDKAANDRALIDGTRLLSAYSTAAGVKFWIITEADRSVTTILLPEDY